MSFENGGISMKHLTRRKRKEIERFLKEELKLTYRQHAKSTIITLLINYPSFKQQLKKAVQQEGLRKIEIGDHIPTASKPTLEFVGEYAIFHLNGEY